MCYLCETEVRPQYRSVLHPEELAVKNPSSSEVDFLKPFAFIIPKAVVGMTTSIKAGAEVIIVQKAIQLGNKDENDLTNLVFFNRHKELGEKKLLKTHPYFDRLSKEWLVIRDNLVRPVLKKTPAQKPVANSSLIKKVERYDKLVNDASKRYGINANTIRSIIAAESGGDPNSGEENPNGYKGLMQAGSDDKQLDPATSRETGVKKYVQFLRTTTQILNRHAINTTNISEDELIEFVMTGYNAGPGTVNKALEYAEAGGNVRKWKDVEYYKRALLYTGAYSVNAPFFWCLNKLSVNTAAQEFSRLTGVESASLLAKYYANNKWNGKELKRVFGKIVFQKLSIESFSF